MKYFVFKFKGIEVVKFSIALDNETVDSKDYPFLKFIPDSIKKRGYEFNSEKNRA